MQLAEVNLDTIIEKWERFFYDYCKEEIDHAALLYPEKKSLILDYWVIDTHDAEMAEFLIEKPYICLYAAEAALKRMDMPVEPSPKLHFRVKNLPETQKIGIRDLRSQHLGKFIAADGLVKKVTEVRPKLEDAAFQCLKCGAIIRVPQNENILKEPLECYEDQGGCGRRTSFRLLTEESKFIDSQKIEIQENPEDLRGGAQPLRLTVYLEDDLVGSIVPGDRVTVNGVMRGQQRRMGNIKLTEFDKVMDASTVEQKEQAFEEVQISDEDEKKIIEVSKDPLIYNKIKESIAPTIYGLDREKDSLALQLFGGMAKHMPDGTRIRGDIHILLVGDPGTAKCVSGDTEILLADGSLCDIKSVVDDEESKKLSGFVDDGMYIETNHDLISLGLNGKNVDSTGNLLWKRFAPEKMYRITTSSGREIKVTPTHPFFVFGDNARVKKRKAEDLKEGEFIATPRKIDIFGEPQPIDINYTRSKARNAVRLNLPDKTTPEFWRFIALFIAEEYLQLKRKDGYQLSTAFFTNNDPQLLDEFCVFAKKIGLNPSYRAAHKGKSARDIIVPRIEFGTFLKNIGTGGPSTAKRIPDLLFKCSKEEISAFLSALFDCEGTVSKKSRGIVLSSASKKLLSQVKHLLLRFGINSQVHPTLSRATNSPCHQKTKYYRLSITGEDAIKFDHEIGFTVAEKKERLKELCNSSLAYNTNVDIIPNISSLLKEIRNKLRLNQSECGILRSSYQHYERGDKNPSRSALSRISQQFDYRMNWLAEARKRLTSSNNWHDLRSIRKSLHYSQRKIADLSGFSQTLLSQYENGKIGCTKIKPKKKCVETTKNKVIGALLKCIEETNVIDLISALKTVANADIFWDRIKKIENFAPEEEFVYDIQVPGYHNFIANDVYVHNSQLLRYVSQLAPRSIYTSGKSSSAAGLTASAIRSDEFGEGRWTLEAGALVLADLGVACVDELDKMDARDRDALHQAMEQQEISIAKAGINATLKSRCSLLGAANPKFGRFDEFASISDQINMPPALLSRFDLIFPVTDRPDRGRDTSLASHILGVHLAGEKMEHEEHMGKEYPDGLESIKPSIDPEFFRKYIAYAKRNVFPVMSEEAVEKLRDYYVEIRSAARDSVPFTPRQLEAFVRIAEASARIRLSDVVTVEDAQRAIGIVDYYLEKVGVDRETGDLDIDIITTGISHSQKDKMKIITMIIKNICKEEECATLEAIKSRGMEEGLDEKTVENMMSKMIRGGIVFEPKRGRYRLTNE
ncbi:MAG: LAGLIDADG family homing endonuclease [Candidatus Thermoplasmatota archaeon]|nr:LAGLIDADG family homing endonuclease [Candidatus Thermoplasmatota archaeon]